MEASSDRGRGDVIIVFKKNDILWNQPVNIIYDKN